MARVDNIIWMDSLEVDTGQWLGKGGQYNLDGLTGGGHWAVARVDNIIWMGSLEVGTGQSLGKGGQYNYGWTHRKWALGSG